MKFFPEIMGSKVCLVTGSTSGIGRCTALEIARRGFAVILHGRDIGRGREAVREIEREAGSEAVDLVLADFSSISGVRKLADELRKRHNRLDVLVKMLEPSSRAGG